MPIISQFYGIVITMYYNETNGKHHIPHIDVRYNNDKVELIKYRGDENEQLYNS